MSGRGKRGMRAGGGAMGIEQRVKLAAEIFDKYGDRIRKIISMLVTDEHLAEDLYQDFFLSLVCAPVPPHVRGARDTVAYLSRTLRNDIIDNSRLTSIRNNHIEKYAEHRKCIVACLDTLDAIINADEVRRMFRLLERRLPRREVEAVILRHSHGLSTDETARKMNIDADSVYRYSCVGLKKIRHAVSQARAVTTHSG